MASPSVDSDITTSDSEREEKAKIYRALLERRCNIGQQEPQWFCEGLMSSSCRLPVCTKQMGTKTCDNDHEGKFQKLGE